MQCNSRVSAWWWITLSALATSGCGDDPQGTGGGGQGASTQTTTSSSSVASSTSSTTGSSTSSTGTGVMPLCMRGELRCVGAQPQQCNASQDGWDNVDAVCATAELCKDGTCNPPVCDVGESKCQGNALMVCNAGRTGFDSTACPQPDAICETNACTHRGPAMSKIDGGPSAFWIDQTEVTNAQYNAFLDAAVPPQSSTQIPAYCAWNTTYGSKNTTAPGDLPVSKVDWCDAYAYCQWAGKRLCGKIGGGPAQPADLANKAADQWYLACAGPTETAYPYGPTYSPSACNGLDKGVGASTSVMSNAGCVNGVGDVVDLSGNVAEWEDLCVGTSGANDVCRVRGGSYTAAAAFLTCGSANTVLRQVGTAANIGFRCCAD